jgi:hypothetical protein
MGAEIHHSVHMQNVAATLAHLCFKNERVAIVENDRLSTTLDQKIIAIVEKQVQCGLAPSSQQLECEYFHFNRNLRCCFFF